MNKALKDGGKVCTQAESMWLHLDLIAKLVKDSSHTFANVEYATTQIPTYPAGQIGLLLCSKQNSGRKQPSCVKPARKVPVADQEKYKYYSSELHEASFTLPAFVARRVAAAKELAAEEKAAIEAAKPKAPKKAASSAGKSAKKRGSTGPAADDKDEDAKAAKTAEEEAKPAEAAAAAPME